MYLYIKYVKYLYINNNISHTYCKQFMFLNNNYFLSYFYVVIYYFTKTTYV